MMTNDGPHPSCEILYVDDEEKALKYFRLALTGKYTVHIATTPKEGLALLRAGGHKIGIVVSDQRMPDKLGAVFLAEVREEFPHIIRILTTAYSDLDSAIQAVNLGHIYQYVVKPWELKDLTVVLRRAADYYHVLSERNELLALKMSALQRILTGDRLVGLLLAPAAATPEFRRALRVYVQALPAPSAFTTERAAVAQFEPTAVLKSEYENAARTLASITGPVPTVVDALATVTQLLSELGLTAETTAGEGNAPLIEVRVPGGQAVVQDLFGLLTARETSALSLAFFRLLLAGAAVQGTVRVTLAEEKIYTFALGEAEPVEAAELIDLLYRRVSAWDIGQR